MDRKERKRGSIRRGLAILLMVCVIMVAHSGVTKEALMAYQNPYTTMKIGLNYGRNTLEAANLLNYVGSGYLFGYYDTTRTFHSVGGTEQTAITMVMDRNMYLSGGGYSTADPGNAQGVIGCYHIRLRQEYYTYEDAAIEAGNYQNAFPAYYYGTWYVNVGSYTSYGAAEAAMYEQNIDGEPMTASAYCVTVVATGTTNILFEFDCGTELSLAVMPKPNTGAKAETWFKGYRYYGAFQYTRINGEGLTVVNMIDIDDYVKGVITIEMSPSWPIEALKAQAVCARTYAASHINKHRSYGFDVCSTTDCQAYIGQNNSTETTNAAVDQTSGKYVLYNGELCQTFYHSSDGGATEDSENVFNEALPYARGVVDIYEKNVNTGYENWTFRYTAEDITWILQNKGYSCGRIVSVTPTYTRMGNMYSLKFTDENGRNLTFTRADACNILDSTTLNKHIYSQRFTIEVEGGGGSSGEGGLYVNDAQNPVESGGIYGIGAEGQEQKIGQSGTVTVITGSGTETVELRSSGIAQSGEVYVVKGSGWGHNVGMSQFGANAMAKAGYTYEDIIKFYYTGVTVE